MPRKRRRCPGGIAYHVMNRATAREAIFSTAADYLAFERVLAEARRREAGRVRVCSYCVMPNHWHLALWPVSGADSAVTAFMKWLALAHAQRWHAHRGTAGTGALYGARFRSFPVQEDGHFLKVCRYVERNPLRAGLVERAEHWPWSGLHKRLAARGPARPPAPPPAGSPGGDGEAAAAEPPPPGAAELLDGWPVPEPPDWLERVNAVETAAELEAVRLCLRRGRPFGDDGWAARTAGRLGLEGSFRRTGRPAKPPVPPC